MGPSLSLSNGDFFLLRHDRSVVCIEICYAYTYVKDVLMVAFLLADNVCCSS